MFRLYKVASLTSTRVMLALALLAGIECHADSHAVEPLRQTTSMHGSGDVADDPALWLHPTNRSKSVLFGTNKASGASGGLYAFNLRGGKYDGADWDTSNWFAQGKRINNVDLRYGFVADGQQWDIIAVANRTDRRVDMFRVVVSANGDFVGLDGVGSIDTRELGGDHPYGLALLHCRSADRHFLIASSKNGNVAQWALRFDADCNRIVGRQVWLADPTPDTKSEVEGIVADDEHDVVYIAVEKVAIFRYSTSDGVIQDGRRVIVDSVDTLNGHLTPDIEGLTIYYASGGGGYLLASSQGSDDFHVYLRQFTSDIPNRRIGAFAVKGVSITDGIDVISTALGSDFTNGLFIAHDSRGQNPSNYKLVPWEAIAEGVRPPLLVDASWDCRAKPDVER